MPLDRRFWIERTKKTAKDSDLAICLLWLTAFPKRPFLTQVGAVDSKQAGIIKRRINDIVQYNEWLNDYVDIHRSMVRTKNGLASVDILTSEVAGSHGENPDVLIINELAHIEKWEFVEVLLANAAGVPRGIVIVATNAGFRGTKAEVLRRTAIESKRWKVYTYSQPAPWLNEDDIKEQKKTLIGSQYDRLWKGVWVSGKGDAFDEQDINRCFNKDLKPLDKPEKNWFYIAGLDLGVKHDHAGGVILGVNINERKLKIAKMKAWEPIETEWGKPEVDLMAVESWCIRMCRLFNINWFGFDPTQASLMSQRLHKQNVPMMEMSFASSTNLTAMAVSLKQIIENHILECFEDERLRRDFGKLNIVEKLPSGYKLEAVSDEYGHADVGIALVICTPRALEMLAGSIGLQQDDDLGYDQDEPFDEAELDDWPDELRDSYMGHDVMDEENRDREERIKRRF